MTRIPSTIDLPHGWHEMYCVADEAEALRIAGGRKAYLFQSKVITSLYLFIPVVEAA